MLELPFLVRSGVFSLVCFRPFPRKEILDYLAHSLIIQVFTVFILLKDIVKNMDH